MELTRWTEQATTTDSEFTKSFEQETGSLMAVSIHSATLGSTGEVRRGRVVNDAQAIVERQEGRDVVVCGADLAINRSTAERIETSANGVSKRCPPHINAGPNALPHYQPKSRPPTGHTIYETDKRKAK